MIPYNNAQAVFTSLRAALISGGEHYSYADQGTARALKDFEAEVPAFGFRGPSADTVEVTVFAGSQVDNRDRTNDWVHFSYGNREYESSEYPYEGGLGYGLMCKIKGDWRRCEEVFAADDKVS